MLHQDIMIDNSNSELKRVASVFQVDKFATQGRGYSSTIVKTKNTPIYYANHLNKSVINSALGKDILPESITNENADAKIIVKNSKNTTVLNSTNVSAMGAQYPIDTLTYVRFEKIVQQKHNEYDTVLSLLDIKMEGTNQRKITVPRAYRLGGNFEAGLTDLVGTNRKQTTQTTTDFVDYKMSFWTGSIDYDILSVGVSETSGFTNYVGELEASQYENFQIGVSQMLMVGAKTISGLEGLLNLQNSTPMPIVNNTSIMNSKYLKDMTPTEFNDFLAQFCGIYLNAIQFTGDNASMMPDTFIMAPDDLTGLVGFVDGGAYGNRTRIEALQNALKSLNPNFQIVTSIFTKSQFNELGFNRYALMNRRSNAFKMSVGHPYTSTVYQTNDSFTFNNVQFAQMSGVQATRPLIVYFTF